MVLSKTQQKILSICLAVMVTGILVGWVRQAWQEPAVEKDENLVTNSPAAPSRIPFHPQKIWVQIGGAVFRPGVYEVTSNQRVLDLLPLAGGVRPQAKLDGINLAQRIKDGQRVVVPFLPVPKSGPKSRGAFVENAASSVDLNSAGLEQLATLPGIGPALAKRIVVYRSKMGGFRSVEDLKNIKGLGGSKFERIKANLHL